MKNRKKILVTGYTGVSSIVASALNNDGRFAVSVLFTGDETTELKKLEMNGILSRQLTAWETNLLADAMRGYDAVFGTTTDRAYHKNEFEYGKKLIDAVKIADVNHFVFESRPAYHAISNSVFSVPNFDTKALLEHYCRTIGINATFIHPSFYFEHFFDDKFLRIDKTGKLYFGFPQGKTSLAMCSIKDIGQVVTMIFRFPEQYVGRVVGIVGDERSCTEYASIFSEILKVNVEYRNMSNTEYILNGGSAEWADMFDVQRIFIKSRSRELIESYGLNPAMTSFRRWVKRNRNQLRELIESGEFRQ
ncbi:NmrA family NAD(P)-binding protein [Pollutibacter soli]|uniref:NmrA family NAD(P)-binding protein n=1 Tax=Pollutibacter soli TaxID=3034157 RepID=UPI003013DE1F